MQALELMNTCAVAVLLELEDVIFAYGHSDEYSFLLKKDSLFYQRKLSQVVSIIVSLFTSSYMMKWKTFFPQKQLMYPPSFDGRAVCYPSTRILKDYLAWRQVDCHINNQYNTCFWLLVKSGISKTEAQLALKGTLAQEKSELLAQQFGVEYNTLPPIFRHGSSVFWEEVVLENENGASSEIVRRRVVVKHCDIIQSSFWKANPSILA
ncbi:tRNA-His guanylyltransferase [Dionaea muscipula]